MYTARYCLRSPGAVQVRLPWGSVIDCLSACELCLLITVLAWLRFLFSFCYVCRYADSLCATSLPPWLLIAKFRRQQQYRVVSVL
jgi:hypothetical protein